MNEAQKAKLDYLTAYRDIMLEISIKEERLARIDEQITGVKAVQLSDMPKGGGVKQTFADAVARRLDLCDEINAQLQTAREKAREIEAAISTMPRRLDRLMLEMRHIDLMSYEEIAGKLAVMRHDQTPYSLRHTLRLYWAAVGRFEIPAEKNFDNVI